MTRTIDQAANASTQSTSEAGTSNTRSETRSTANTVRWPSSVDSVSTCQRRRRRPIVSPRKCANDSPPQRTGFRRTRCLSHETSRAAKSPTLRASAALQKPMTRPAIAATSTMAPIRAIVRSSGWPSPSAVSIASATIGKPKMISWFQTPVSVTASVTSPVVKPQPRSMSADTAIPGAKPPGAMYVEAVEAWVTTNAWRKPRPGQRRHPVRRIRDEVRDRGDHERDDPLPRERLDDAPHVAVVGDPRQDEDERRGDHRDREPAADQLPRAGAERAFPWSGSRSRGLPSPRTLVHMLRRMELSARRETLVLAQTFRIARETQDTADVVQVDDPARRARGLRRGGSDRSLRGVGRLGSRVARGGGRSARRRSLGAGRDRRPAAARRVRGASRPGCGAPRPLREAGRRSALPATRAAA